MRSRFTTPEIDHHAGSWVAQEVAQMTIRERAALPEVVSARRQLAKRVVERVSTQFWAKFDLEKEFHGSTFTIDVAQEVTKYLEFAQDPSAILARGHLQNMIRRCCETTPNLAVKFVNYNHERRVVHFQAS